MSAGDEAQGRYLHDLLTVQRTDLEKRLEALHAQAMKHTASGDESQARNIRRITRVLESDAHAVDRMLKALSNRLGMSVQACTLEAVE